MNRSYSKIRHIQESNQLLEKRILKEQHKFRGYNSSIVLENVTTASPDIINKANNKIKGLSRDVVRSLSNYGVNTKENVVQEYLNGIVDNLSKQNSNIVTLINNKRPSSEIGNVYLTTIMNTFYQIFNSEVGWTKKLIIRNSMKKEEFMKKVKPHMVGSLIYDIITESTNSLPLDTTKIGELRKYIQHKRISNGEKLINWMITKIY
jgi:hypothetical protein